MATRRVREKTNWRYSGVITFSFNWSCPWNDGKTINPLALSVANQLENKPYSQAPPVRWDTRRIQQTNTAFHKAHRKRAGISNDCDRMRNERECKIMLHKSQRCKTRIKKKRVLCPYNIYIICKRAEFPRPQFLAKCPGRPHLYQLTGLKDIRALAPKLAGTVTTLKPRLFTSDSLSEKRRGLLCNFGSSRMA